MRPRWAAGVLFRVGLGLGLGAPAAHAASPSFPVVTSVAVVAPGSPDAVVVQALSRLRSELGAVGLASHAVSCADEAAADARACALQGKVASAASEPRNAGSWLTTASIVVAREAGVVSIEVIERLSNGSKFFRLVYVAAAEGGNDPAVLAIRGVELLRDVHLDIERTGAGAEALAPTSVTAGATVRPPPSAPPAVVPDGPPATQIADAEGAVADGSPSVVAAAERSRKAPLAGPPWTLHGSLGFLQGRAGAGPSWGPALGATFRLGDRWALWTTLAGPFYEELGHETSTAETRQELAMAGARRDWGTTRVRPFVTAGAGLYHLRATGTSQSALDTRLVSTMWAPLLAAGAGCSYPLGRLVDVAVEAQAFVTMPSGSVLIRSVEVSRTGAPSVLAQAELRVRLP